VCDHNIIQIHNNVLWNWQYLHNISHIRTNYRKQSKIFREILSILQNIVTDLNNNVMNVVLASKWNKYLGDGGMEIWPPMTMDCLRNLTKALWPLMSSLGQRPCHPPTCMLTWISCGQWEWSRACAERVAACDSAKYLVHINQCLSGRLVSGIFSLSI
jgi:hypothetical protein